MMILIWWFGYLKSIAKFKLHQFKKYVNRHHDGYNVNWDELNSLWEYLITKHIVKASHNGVKCIPVFGLLIL